MSVPSIFQMLHSYSRIDSHIHANLCKEKSGTLSYLAGYIIFVLVLRQFHFLERFAGHYFQHEKSGRPAKNGTIGKYEI